MPEAVEVALQSMCRGEEAAFTCPRAAASGGAASLVPPPPQTADTVELELSLLSMIQVFSIQHTLSFYSDTHALGTCSPAWTTSVQAWRTPAALVGWHRPVCNQNTEPQRDICAGSKPDPEFKVGVGWGLVGQVRDMTGDGKVMKRRLKDGRGEFPVDCPIEDSTVRVQYRQVRLPSCCWFTAACPWLTDSLTGSRAFTAA